MSLGEAVKRNVKNYSSMSDTEENRVDEDSEVGRIVRPIKSVEDKLEMEQFASNRIRTTRYTILTFLPKNLFEQFQRFANFFFLFIVVLNFIPQINSFGKEVAALPLLFVLSVTAIKDIFEDRRRYVSDRELNNRQCQVYNSYAKGYVSTAWKDVHVGDIVKLDCNSIMPADLLLVWSSDPNSLCYIETSNLDGESNLKHRQCPKGFTQQNGGFDPAQLDVEVRCEEPDIKIYHFNGYVITSDGSRVPLDSSHMLLRGCVLRNTSSAVGLVIYAGPDTKAMKNNSGPQYKRSKLERAMNYDVVWCMGILLFLCIAGAIGDSRWLIDNDYRNVLYLGWEDDDKSAAFDGFLRFWSFIITLQIIVPISLYVSIEIVKLGQVFFLQMDIEMYHKKSDTPMKCRALNINENLGQVEYVFCDKTGTLTENEMIFRKCSISGTRYGGPSAFSDSYEPHTNIEEIAVDSNVSHSSSSIVVDSSLRGQLAASADATDGPSTLSREQEFMVLMATCNTVVVAERFDRNQAENRDGNFTDSGSSPEREGREKVYEAESPDEIALVNAAKAYGVTLKSRTPDSMTVDVPGFGSVDYAILHVLAFTSERKRMSVILRDRVTQEITLYCKGADSTMYSILRPESFCPPTGDERNPMQNRGRVLEALAEITQRHMDGFARNGLRTLCIAKRVIDPKEYDNWLKQREAAEQALTNREVLLEETACAIEHDLELLGATGIEDRLQDGVPATMQALRDAGIVVWVLTGDKQETAINVAFSCQLFDSGMEIIKVNALSKEECKDLLDIRKQEIKSQLKMSTSSVPNASSGTSSEMGVQSTFRQSLGLVIDGKTLEFALKDDLKDKFLELAKRCQSVICCRAAPIQKAAVVKLVKEKEKVLCLAVGDGANDVSMIQMADVGVGISGNEGMQAVMASDFSLGRFKFLTRLLLVHGHWCYDRLANMILYFFYKNAVYVFLLFWYQIYCGWSSVVPMEQFLLVLYGVVFTAWPPMIAGIIDQDISADKLIQNPHLYSQGRLAKTYTTPLFWLSIIDALWQSLVMFYVSFLAYYDGDVGRLEFGTTQNTASVLTVLLHLAVEMHFWTWVHHCMMWASIVSCFAWPLFYDGLFRYPGKDNAYWVMQHAITTGNFWFCIILTPAIALLPRILANVVKELYFPTPVQKARQMSRIADLSTDVRETGDPVVLHLSSSSILSAENA